MWEVENETIQYALLPIAFLDLSYSFDHNCGRYNTGVNQTKQRIFPSISTDIRISIGSEFV